MRRHYLVQYKNIERTTVVISKKYVDVRLAIDESFTELDAQIEFIKNVIKCIHTPVTVKGRIAYSQIGEMYITLQDQRREICFFSSKMNPITKQRANKIIKHWKIKYGR